jgi:hypothetical protein
MENITSAQKSSLKYREKNRQILNLKAREKYREKKLLFSTPSFFESKQCSSCKKELPLSEYTISYSSKDWYTYTCRKCIRTRNNTKINMIKKMLRGAKERSVQNNLEFDLDIDFLVKLSKVENCPVFGIRLEWEYDPDKKDIHKNKDNRPSLDRINSQRGYTKDNVKIISWRANKLKNESTLKELQEIIDYMRSHLNDTSRDVP